jgi:hypothetical protein
MPDEPRAMPLSLQAPQSYDAGVVDQELMAKGVRWAIVEYASGSQRSRWCATPHTGYVVTGSIQYDFEDGREPLLAESGTAFLLPSAPRHKGRNQGGGPARIFLIDALPIVP